MYSPPLAAAMVAIMISSFVLLVHIPGVIAAPNSRLQWTMLFVASALAGAAWTVAASFQFVSKDRASASAETAAA